MSARILPFTGEWHGQTEPKRCASKRQTIAESRAIHDARLIREAKGANDDWTARLLLAWLSSIDRKTLELLEFRLLGPTMDSESGAQALAVVQLATGTKTHREAVGNHLRAFAAREVE